MISIKDLPYYGKKIDIIPLLYKKGKIWFNMGVSRPIFTCIKTKAVDDVQRWVNKGSDMRLSIEKQVIWKTIIFTFYLLQSRTHDSSESKNVSQGKAQFLAEIWGQCKTYIFIYGYLQNILRFHKNKYTVNSQLQSLVDKHSDLKTLREWKVSNVLKKT